MAVDTKKYLDYVGLSYYDEKIKAYIKTNGSDVTDKLVALIGAAEKGADEATILARIADLESAVGDVSELGEEVENLVKAILGEAARAAKAEGDLQDAIDAEQKRAEGAESDLQDAIDAEAERAKGAEGDLQDNIDALDEKLYGSDSETDGESVHVKGDIDKIQDRLTALEEDTEDADAVKALEERLYGKGEGEEHVDGTIDEINSDLADLHGAVGDIDALNDSFVDEDEKDVDNLVDAVNMLDDKKQNNLVNYSEVANGISKIKIGDVETPQVQVTSGSVDLTNRSVNITSTAGAVTSKAQAYGDATSYAQVSEVSNQIEAKVVAAGTEKVSAYMNSGGAQVKIDDNAKININGTTGVEVTAKEGNKKFTYNGNEVATVANIGELGKVSEEEGAADHTVKSYVDAAVAAINGDADALDERVETLEGLHAKKEDESFKTVAEEVNEAVVALVDGAPDALDTLKEIADWIANQDESGVTDAATLVARVEENAQAIADETERAEGAESDLQDAIDAVEEKVDAFERITETEIDALFGEVTEEETEETP